MQEEEGRQVWLGEYLMVDNVGVNVIPRSLE